MPCEDPENYGEVATYNQFCEHAKELAKQWLGID
jgi:hypothetical protein